MAVNHLNFFQLAVCRILTESFKTTHNNVEGFENVIALKEAKIGETFNQNNYHSRENKIMSNFNLDNSITVQNDFGN